MAIVFVAFGAAYAAVAVWLTVRIINRRERWAKRTAAALVGLSVLYVLSSGPMQCVAFRSRRTHVNELSGPGMMIETIETGFWWPAAYAPLLWASEQSWGDVVNWYWRLFPIPAAVEHQPGLRPVTNPEQTTNQSNDPNDRGTKEGTLIDTNRN